MNLVRGTSEGAGFKAGGQLAAAAAAGAARRRAGAGRAPEHVELSFDLQASGWPLRVPGARDAGRGAPRLRHARRDPLHRPARRDRAHPKVGDIVNIAVTPEHMHWFDAATTARVGA
jgi:sn-glycerol 3-phosphate transport system ATP-binding protein